MNVMQSAAKHLARHRYSLIDAPNEMLRCALHDVLFRSA